VQAGTTCGTFTLEDVVVTSPSYDKEGTSTFFVQDPATGAGVAVYTKNDTYAATVGDVISLTGTATEYYDLTEVVVDDVATIVTTGTGTPVATELDAAPSDWEPYEGQLLTLTDVTATSAPSYGQVSTNYAGLFLDDLFVRYDVANGDTFASVTGVLYYNYEEWKLEPRSEADLVR
jgi:predicted extracellular nuclease